MTTSPSEFQIQCAVAGPQGWLAQFGDPGWMWTHFPAGELRHPVIGAKLREMGTKSGWADVLLISPQGQLHALELKAGKAPLSDPQEAFRDGCLERRVPWALSRSLDEALDQLCHWGALSKLRLMP